LVGQQEFRNAEVEKLRHAGLIDQDVSGLKVAVHNEMPVRMLDGSAYGKEKTKPLLDVEVVLGSVLRYPGALNVLHDEIWRSIVRRAAVEELRDIRMLKAGEDLPLAAKASQDEVGVETRLHHLDSDFRLILLIVARSEINGAHSAAS